MEYGININFFRKTLSLEQAAQMIAQAGFTQLDYTPNLRSDSWAQDAREAMAIFADNGLTVHQTHAPFNRYNNYGDQHHLCLQRCAEATELLGAKYMVAHGDEFDFDNLEFTPERALDYNYQLFLPYVERAKQAGFRVAFETVFEDSKKRRRFTSQGEELLSLIDAYQSPHAVCCWDFGHGHVTFKAEAPNWIRQFGSRIQCVHLHDNAGNDSHQMPLTGDIHWPETVAAFREIGYRGIMSVEYAHGTIPAALVGDFMNLTIRAARSLWD